MNEIEFTYQDLYEAYRKLKSYFYYDNTSLFIRKQISDYEFELVKQPIECNDVEFKKRFEEKTKELKKALNHKDERKALKKYINNISYKLVPKNIEKESYEFITNKSFSKDVIVSKCNFIIDAPIEIHIISVLWLMFVGKHFNSEISNNNYAYQLIISNDNYSPTPDITVKSEEEAQGITSGLQLYKPYFIGYQQWRDKALSIATNLLDEKKDATILSLDIQRYFYSVRLNINELLKKHNKNNKLNIDLNDTRINKLCNIIQAVNEQYTKIVNNLLDDQVSEEDLSKKNTILPVGLLSSGFLGNLYLSDFDKEIIQKLNPAYYGRYVDDILFVFSERNLDYQTNKVIASFIKDNFEQKNILINKSSKQVKECGKETAVPIYHIQLHQELKIQYEKVILEHFYHNESRAAINKFKLNIDKQRSEFRFLPDEEKVENEFDNEAFSLQYSDSINKLRSIKEFKEDKFGASKFLAHKIFLSSYTINSNSHEEKHSFYKSAKQILTFFKGSTSISFYSLWEKVATYFIINSETECLDRFIKQTQSAINKIQIKDSSNKDFSRLKNDLMEHLRLSIAFPYSLNLKFKQGVQLDNLKLSNDAEIIRMTNMFRHNLIGISGINYTNLLFDKKINLLQIKNQIEIEAKNIITSYLSPRFVHYNELNIIEIHKCLSQINNPIANEIDNINETTNTLYYNINYRWRNIYKTLRKKQQPLYNKMPKERICTFKTIEDKNYISKTSANKKIGIVNIKVHDNDIFSSICANPNLSKERRKTLFNIINNAVKEKCEILVLPELSIPFEWLDLLAYQSQTKNIAIIAGLEYYINKHSYVFNCVATILPIRRDTFATSIIRLRVKNHYSPDEKELLRGYRLKIPTENSKSFYDLFHWRKSYFSVYNCFELADISDRALFKSKVDFIIATELNKDTNYFADIGSTWVRDLHCFFIQVNTSHYGDSKIIQPTKSETKNIVTAKGGLNSIVLVEYINIDKLREFQLKEYNLQKEDKEFKPTPPRFNIENVKARIFDLDFQEEENNIL